MYDDYMDFMNSTAVPQIQFYHHLRQYHNQYYFRHNIPVQCSSPAGYRNRLIAVILIFVIL